MKPSIPQLKQQLALLIPQVQKKLVEIDKRTNKLEKYDKAWTKTFKEWQGIFVSFQKMMEFTQGSHGLGQHMPAMYKTVQEATRFILESNEFQGELREYYRSATILFTQFAKEIQDISDATLSRNLEAMRAKVSGNEFSEIIAKGDELLKECGMRQTQVDDINAKIKAAKPMAS